MTAQQIVNLDNQIKDIDAFYAIGSNNSRSITNLKYESHMRVYNEAISLMNDGLVIYPHCDTKLTSHHKTSLRKQFSNYFTVFLGEKWNRKVRDAKRKIDNK